MIVQPQRKIFVLDTSVLIELAIWLPIDLNNNFWSNLSANLQGGNWVLIDEVMHEIKKKYNPELKVWCDSKNQAGLVRAVMDEDRARGVAINGLYTMIDTATQRSTVDTYLIAFAERNGLTVFTREGGREKTGDPYKIPDVCTRLKIDWIREPHVFFRAMGYKN